MKVEWLFKDRDVRIPRKVKKQARKSGLVITGRLGNTWKWE